MNISYHTILKKMEEKLIEAKSISSDSKVREHVQAIKTLCEVILMEDGQSESTYQPPVQTQRIKVQSSQQIYSPQTPQQTTTLGERKLETDDGANGDSLFDF